MVSSLVGAVSDAGTDGAPRTLPAPSAYERQLSCQIWSLDGRMVARSTGAPERRLTEAPAGFSQREVDGETWRVFTVEDAEKGVRVMVGDRLSLRERLVTDLIMGLVTPALLVVPLLGMLIWASLGRGLRPLRLMAGNLAARDADDMSAIDAGRAPTEVRPLADALNGLFLKVEAARSARARGDGFRRSRASHTARRPEDPGPGRHGSRRPGGREGRAPSDPLGRRPDDAPRPPAPRCRPPRCRRGDAAPDHRRPSARWWRETVEGMRAPAGIQTRIAPELHGYTMRADPESLRLAVRNLHENAVQHMQAGLVEWAARSGGGGIVVRDEGPGIPEDELPQVTKRFFRGRHKSPTGSGLGLAIAEMASRRSGLSLRLRNRPDRLGLEAEILAG